VAAAELARLGHVADLETLEDVLRWGFAQRPGWDVVEVVVQDELTHDVIVRGPSAVLLVFDTT
jgi:hypothetical protein